MNSAIIAIGDELVSGFRSETNSKWLAKKLSSIGIDTSLVIIVEDNDKNILSTLNQVSINPNIDYVFITGGLGPTNDDITLKALAAFLKSELFFDQEYFDSLKKRLKVKEIEVSDSAKNQAMRIKGTDFIKNDTGTALGVSFLKNGKVFLAYPGVPSEFKKMFLDGFFKEKNDLKRSVDSIVLNTMASETRVYERLKSFITDSKNEIKFSFLPSYKGVTVRLTSLSQSIDILKVKNEIIKKLGSCIYSEGDKSLESVVANLLMSKKLTIGVSESCTGGLLNSIISSIPNSSSFYNGGIVAYSNSLKINILNIEKDEIEKYGAVSSQVGISMAKNIAVITNSDIGISTTGYSGPTGGDSSNSNGTVYVSIKFSDKTYSRKYIFTPNRDTHREFTAYKALNFLRLILMGEIK